MFSGDYGKVKTQELENAQQQLEVIISSIQSLKSKQKLETVQTQSLVVKILNEVNKATGKVNQVTGKLQEVEKEANIGIRKRAEQETKRREKEVIVAQERIDLANKQVLQATAKLKITVAAVEKVVAIAKNKLQDIEISSNTLKELSAEQEFENMFADGLAAEIVRGVDRIATVIEQVSSRLNTIQETVAREEVKLEEEQVKKDAAEKSMIKQRLTSAREQSEQDLASVSNAMAVAEVKIKSSKDLSKMGSDVQALKFIATEAFSCAKDKFQVIKTANRVLKKMKPEDKIEDAKIVKILEDITKASEEIFQSLAIVEKEIAAARKLAVARVIKSTNDRIKEEISKTNQEISATQELQDAIVTKTHKDVILVKPSKEQLPEIAENRIDDKEQSEHKNC